MPYKFIGRIEEIGIIDIKAQKCDLKEEKGEKKQSQDVKRALIGYNQFCKFRIDNTIKIDGENKGVAYDGSKIEIVDVFNNINDEIFALLSSLCGEVFEVEYEKNPNQIITKIVVKK